MKVILARKLGTIPMGKLDLRARYMAALTLMVDLEFSNKTPTTV